MNETRVYPTWFVADHTAGDTGKLYEFAPLSCVPLGLHPVAFYRVRPTLPGRAKSDGRESLRTLQHGRAGDSPAV